MTNNVNEATAAIEAAERVLTKLPGHIEQWAREYHAKGYAQLEDLFKTMMKKLNQDARKRWFNWMAQKLGHLNKWWRRAIALALLKNAEVQETHGKKNETVYLTVGQLRQLIKENVSSWPGSPGDRTYLPELEKAINVIADSMDVSRKKVVDMITPLKTNNLTKYLGKGAFGMAFKMSNGNVLKITAMNDKQKAFLKSAQGRLHQKSASKHTPMIYDWGELGKYDGWIEIELLETESDHAEKVKEVARAINFEIDWVKDALLRDYFVDHPDEAGMSFAEQEKLGYSLVAKLTPAQLREMVEDEDIRVRRAFAKLDDNVIEAALRAVLDALKSSHYAQDLHGGNIGVRGGAPVYFDPVGY